MKSHDEELQSDQKLLLNNNGKRNGTMDDSLERRKMEICTLLMGE